MEIVTGSTGKAHVTPVDDAVRNSNLGYYDGKVVFDLLRSFEAIATTANEVKVYSGYGMNQGRLFKIEQGEFDSVTIENGSQGLKRSDLIVARYTMDTQTGTENIKLVVIKGSSGSDYIDPSENEIKSGNINEGATEDDFPLYRVKINGIVIEAVEPLFTAVPDGGRIGLIEIILNLVNAQTGEIKKSWADNSVLVGNANGYPTEKGIDTVVSADSENLITSGAVHAAMSDAGLGDMLKSEWTADGYLAENKGGIGNRKIKTSLTSSAAGSSDLITAGAVYSSYGTLLNGINAKADSSDLNQLGQSLGDQVTYSLSGTTLTITTK